MTVHSYDWQGKPGEPGASRFLITGGAGFIGSAVVRKLIRETCHRVLVLDKLTYAGNLDSLAAIHDDPRYSFVRGDIDEPRMSELVTDFAPDVIMHLAAESHVDRSIDGPGEFLKTNVHGTFNLLQAALVYWRSLPPSRKQRFRFHHVSTDEVFGSLGPEGLFSEASAYDPRSPFGVKSRIRPSRSRLAPHLRPSHARHQLLQQLRPVPISREANPAHNPERLGRQAPACLRHG